MTTDIQISMSEYQYLVKRSTMLGYLECHGVTDSEEACEALDERICGETFREYCQRIDSETFED